MIGEYVFRKWSISLFLFLVFIMGSCKTKEPSREDIIRESINKTVFIDGNLLVYHNDTQVPFSVVRQDYDYISVVYLLDDCQTCYVKYLNWNEGMQKLDLDNLKYTVLFVVLGADYYGFMEEVYKIEFVENPWSVLMDENFLFLDTNSHLFREALDASVLIDRENRIKMVGAPWVNAEMTDLFYTIVNDTE